MTDTNELILRLITELGHIPKLRMPLFNAIHAAAVETDRDNTGISNLCGYMELLPLIKGMAESAESAGSRQTASALMRLFSMLKDDIDTAAVIIHNALDKGTAASHPEEIRITGIDPGKFPIGFPVFFDLVDLSMKFKSIARDLEIISQYLPDHFTETDGTGLAERLNTEKRQIETNLHDTAWEALGRFIDNNTSDPKITELRNAYYKNAADLVEAAQDELESIAGRNLDFKKSGIDEIEKWLSEFGRAGIEILAKLPPEKQNQLMTILIGSKLPESFTAFCKLDAASTAQETLAALFVIRFGPKPYTTVLQWKTWFKQYIADTSRFNEAVLLWSQNPWLFSYLFDGLPFPEAVEADRDVEQVRVLKDFLDRHKKNLLQDEIDIIESVISGAGHSDSELSQESEADTHEADRETGIRDEPAPDIINADIINADIINADAGNTDEKKPVESGTRIAAEIILEDIMGETLVDAASEVISEAGLSILTEKTSVKIEQEPEQVQRERIRPEESVRERLWLQHIQTFISKNLFFVLSSTAIVIGLLLLVLTMWDKAAWIRYGLSPVMIVAVAFGLSFIGKWLKLQDTEIKTPVVVLEAAAVFLAPMSLLFVAILSVDPNLSVVNRVLWGIGLSGVLLVAWWFIFKSSIKIIHPAMTKILTLSLLFLNALLLLLSAALFLSLDQTGAVVIGLKAKGVLIAGFYAGFTALIINIRSVLNRILLSEIRSTNIPLVFYCVASLGTFFLVWGLVHARLGLLPQVHTYGPLLVMAGFLISMIEFGLLEETGNTGRIGLLCYFAYSLIVLGVMLSFSEGHVRTLSLLLAGSAWFYQAVKLQTMRHFTISLIIFILGFSAIARINGFPLVAFPYLALVISVVLLTISKKTTITPLADSARRLSPVYLSLAFVGTIALQWAARIDPFPLGTAFVLFGFFWLYMGAVKDSLVHVHAGVGAIAIALPYLGFCNMSLYTLTNNTLVFGLSILGLFWIVFSTRTKTSVFKDCRSTILWNIGMLALCLMMIRLFSKDLAGMDLNFLTKLMVVGGPFIITLLMLTAGYFSRSWIPVVTALVMIVLILPEIKSQFGISMRSGLGTSTSVILLIGITVFCTRWKFLKDLGQGDLIFRRRVFPGQLTDHRLFTIPAAFSALFLMARVICWTYPNLILSSASPISFKTFAAIVLAGLSCHYFSFYFKSRWPSFAGYAVIAFALPQYVFETRSVKYFLPFSFVIAILINFIIIRTSLFLRSKSILSEKDAENIIRPTSFFEIVIMLIAGFILFSGCILPVSYHWFWIVAALYFCVHSMHSGWKTEKRFFLLASCIFLWQAVILTTAAKASYPSIFYPESSFYLATSLLILFITCMFPILKKYLPSSRISWLSFILWISLVWLAGLAGFVFIEYLESPDRFFLPRIQFISFAVTAFLIGRYLNLAVVWVFGLLAFLLIFIPNTGRIEFHVLAFHPLALSVVALIFALLSTVTRQKTWFSNTLSFSWHSKRKYSPSFVFAASSQIISLAVLILTLTDPLYFLKPLCVTGLFIVSAAALFSARGLTKKLSRIFLSTFWLAPALAILMLCLKSQFPSNAFLIKMDSFYLIAIGSGIWLLISLMTQNFSAKQDSHYNLLKSILGFSIPILLLISHFDQSDITSVSMTCLITAVILLFLTSFYFKSEDRINPSITFSAGYVISLSLGICYFGFLFIKPTANLFSIPVSVYLLLFLSPSALLILCECSKPKSNYTAKYAKTATVWLSMLVALYIIPQFDNFLIPQHYTQDHISISRCYQYAPVLLMIGLAFIRLIKFGYKKYCASMAILCGTTCFFVGGWHILYLAELLNPLLIDFALSDTGGFIHLPLPIKFPDAMQSVYPHYAFTAGIILLVSCAYFYLRPSQRDAEHISCTPKQSAETSSFTESYILFLENSLKENRSRSILLWLFTPLVFIFGAEFLYLYFACPQNFAFINLHLIAWAVTGVIIGYFLHLPLIWLWSIFIVYPLLVPAIGEYSQTFAPFLPLPISVLALFLACLSHAFTRFNCCSSPLFAWPWSNNRLLSPQFVFAIASQFLVVIVFTTVFSDKPIFNLWPTAISQNISLWPAVISLYISVLAAIPTAHTLGLSRRFLAGLPFALACIGLAFALDNRFMENLFTDKLNDFGLIGFGLLLAIPIIILSDLKKRQDKDIPFHELKTAIVFSMLASACFLYLQFFPDIDINRVNLPVLLTISILCLSAGFMSRYCLVRDAEKTGYTLFVSGFTSGIIFLGIFFLIHIAKIAVLPENIGWIMFIPPLVFFLRAEYQHSQNNASILTRSAAIFLLAITLVFYLYPPLLQVCFFVEHDIKFYYFHLYSPIVLITGLAMLRLHAQGSGKQAAFFGILSILTAIFFMITSIPFLSLSQFPIRAAMTAVIETFLFLLFTSQAGMVRNLISKFANLDKPAWEKIHNFCLSWLLIASHFLTIFAIVTTRTGINFYQTGILIIMLAGLVIFYGHILKKKFLFHAGFYELLFSASCCWEPYTSTSMLMAVFILLIPAYQWYFKPKFAQFEISYHFWSALTAILIIYTSFANFGPGAGISILILGFLWGGLFFVPVSKDFKYMPMLDILLGFMAYCPVIGLSLYYHLRIETFLPHILLTAAAISCAVEVYRAKSAQIFVNTQGRTFRIAHHFHEFLIRPSRIFPVVVQLVVTAIVINIMAEDNLFPLLVDKNRTMMLIIQGFLAAYWFFRAQIEKFWIWTIIAQIMVLTFLMTLREPGARLFDIDIETWDMCAGIFLAFAITAMRPIIKKGNNALTLPIKFTLLGLPLITAFYAYRYSVDFETLARIILLYSVLFTWKAYTEKDRYILSYAFAGFNAYLFMTFAHKEIHSIQAYAVPLAITVLVLVQFFKDITTRTTANIVRSLALLLLLGVSAFEALVDNYLSYMSHLILIGICLMTIVASVFLRIRIFALAGFCGIILDFIAVIYIVLSRQDVETVKVVMGVVLTVGGGLTLTGYIFYRKHKVRIEGIVARFKNTFLSWE
ncbi:hypothetical protein QUF76_07670 [Desulfobacterales bacterium HSG16]|nr:hypothetical protein [Desulfobacterales bacterium HSG16]